MGLLSRIFCFSDPAPVPSSEKIAHAASRSSASDNGSSGFPGSFTPNTTAATDNTTSKVPVATAAPSATGNGEIYSPAVAKSLFNEYADDDEPDVIGPEGYTRLCTDAGIDLEGALPLIFSWQFGAKEMAKITRVEWESGTNGLRVSSLANLRTALSELSDLLLTDAAPILPASTTAPSSVSSKNNTRKKAPTSSEPYDRSRYHRAASNREAVFKELYVYCFTIAQPEGSRNIDMEVAIPFWTVLLSARYPIVTEIAEFINEKGTYNRVNKDLWTMVLEFCQTVKPSLDDYEADGAWPTMIDEFVEWKKAKAS